MPANSSLIRTTPEAQDRTGMARRRLSAVVQALYAGVTLKLPGGCLCYRGAGEELPDLPRSRAVKAGLGHAAMLEGLYRGSPVCEGTGTRVVDERWLGVGGLEHLASELATLKAPTDLAAEMSRRMAALGDRLGAGKPWPLVIDLSEVREGQEDAENRHESPPDVPTEVVSRARRYGTQRG